MDRFIITLDRGEVKSIPFYVTQGDNKSQIIPVQLLKDGLAYNLTGKTIKLAVINSKGNGDLIDLKNTTPTIGEFEIPLDGLLTSQVGNCNIQIGIFASDGYLLHTSIIRYYVNESLFESISGDIEEDSSFKNILENFKKLDEWNAYFESTSGKIEEKYTTRLNGIDASLEEKANQLDLEFTKSKVELKSDKSYVDTEFNKKADKNEVFSMANMGQDVKTAMTGGSVAVVGKNTVLTENIVDNQVVPSKTTFVKTGENLFNKNSEEIILGKSINYQGTIIDSLNYAISHRVIVYPNQTLIGYFNYTTFGGSCNAYLYDINNNYLGKISPTNTGEIGILTISGFDNVAYIKFNILKTNLDKIMLVLGSVYPTSYIEFYYTMTDDFKLNKKQYESIKVSENNITEKAVAPIKTSFLDKTINIFNKNNVDLGKMIDYRGVIVDSVNYSISEKIYINNADVLTGYFNNSALGGNACAFFFDINDTYVSKLLPTTFVDEVGTITVPSDNRIKYVRFNILKTNLDKAMLVYGSVYPKSYIPCTFMLSDKIILQDSHFRQSMGSPLYGKIAVFDGDSICNAISDNLDGWAGRIAKNNSMGYTNYAKDGATITNGLMADGNPRHWISKSVVDMRTDADYIIFEGGTNDADLLGSGNLGTVSMGYNATLDDTTFSGALESTFKQAILKFKGKKIGYIVAHKMGTGLQADNRKSFFDRAIEICKKWGIPYINLWDTSYLNPNIQEIRDYFYTDGQHLKSISYDVLSDKIEAWMKTL